MIHIGFLWHMHQPLYVDPATGVSVLPWVRLHATRAYYDMARVAADYPAVHTTINLVPVLLHQLELLAQGGRDRYRDVALRRAEELTESEARFIIDQFFQADWGTLVYPNPGYRRLLELRGGENTLPDAVSRFKPQDLRDLQVWFNLAWFGFTAIKEYPSLQALRRQQKDFTEDDKKEVFRIQDEILQKIIRLYIKLQQDGTAEISTTPYYHPILPLVYDTNLARRALPHINLPNPSFQSEEDARAQVQLAVDSYRRIFGQPPRGMWPSEGSVAPEIIPILKDAGLRWFATSEGILHCSSLDERGGMVPRDHNGRPTVLTPYLMGDVAAVFRHLELSDLIGFTYQRMPGRDAAEDLLRRVKAVAGWFERYTGRPALVPIILDGENPWEHYRDGGEGFLRSLYESIERDPDLRAVTISEHLDQHPPAFRISHLWTGSWINSNFAIWAGHPEDVAGWERLRDARAFLRQAEKEPQRYSAEALASARQSIYAAEGSDWFWWYGEEFSSQSDHEFDRLFRAHLADVYLKLGAQPPGNLSIPIKGMRRYHRLRAPVSVLRPQVDGRLTTYYEWIDAGEVPLQAAGGAMARGSLLLRKLAWGFDERCIYFRVDFGQDQLEFAGTRTELNLLMAAPVPLSVRIPLHRLEPSHIQARPLTGERQALTDAEAATPIPAADLPVSRHRPGSEITVVIDRSELETSSAPSAVGVPDARIRDDMVLAACDEVLELAIPRSLVHLHGGGILEFYLLVCITGGEVIRYPAREIYQLEVPSWDQMKAWWNP